MTIDFHNSEPECSRLLIKWFKIIGLAHGCPLLQPVTVHDHREPIKLVLGCGHHGLPIAALLQLAISNEHVGATLRDIELRRERVADCDR